MTNVRLVPNLGLSFDSIQNQIQNRDSVLILDKTKSKTKTQVLILDKTKSKTETQIWC